METEKVINKNKMLYKNDNLKCFIKRIEMLKETIKKTSLVSGLLSRFQLISNKKIYIIRIVIKMK